MSVITHDGKVVVSGGKTLNFDALIALANATTGESDKTLGDAVSSLIAGYGGGGGILHDHGTIAFHTGSILTTCTIPMSEPKDKFIIFARATKTWVNVDGAWTERESLDFTGLTQYAFDYILSPSFYLSQSAWTNKSGVSVAANAVILNRPYINPSLTEVGAISAKASSSALPKYSNGNITFQTGTGYLCRTDFGLTIEYDIWGWNDAE